jgi:ribokinase
MSVLVFGSINLDLIFPLPHLPAPGETVLGTAMRAEPGGKGANQAVAASRDGARVALAGAVGQDAFAEPALALLRGAGVDLTRVARLEGATGCAAIAVDREGRNQIAVAPGVNLAAAQDMVEDAALGPATVLVVQRECDAGEIARLLLRATRRGTRAVVNLAPFGGIALDALATAALVVVNAGEAAALAGALGCADQPTALARRLGTRIVVTRGEAGAVLADGDGAHHQPAFPVRAVDTTGAGDGFVGVLAASLDRGLDLPAALRRAAAAAALACTRPGTQSSLPHAAETDVLAASGP